MSARRNWRAAYRAIRAAACTGRDGMRNCASVYVRSQLQLRARDCLHQREYMRDHDAERIGTPRIDGWGRLPLQMRCSYY